MNEKRDREKPLRKDEENEDKIAAAIAEALYSKIVKKSISKKNKKEHNSK